MTKIAETALNMLKEGNVDDSASNLGMAIFHLRRYLFALSEAGAGNRTVDSLLEETVDPTPIKRAS
jgi:hypothetical protein